MSNGSGQFVETNLVRSNRNFSICIEMGRSNCMCYLSTGRRLRESLGILTCVSGHLRPGIRDLLSYNPRNYVSHILNSVLACSNVIPNAKEISRIRDHDCETFAENNKFGLEGADLVAEGLKAVKDLL